MAKYIVLLMLTGLPLLTLVAQDAKKAQEPEYIGIVFYLDPAGPLSPLERQQPNFQTKVKALGYGGLRAQLSSKVRSRRYGSKRVKILGLSFG